MTDLDQHEAIQFFVSIDVGKSRLHAVALLLEQPATVGALPVAVARGEGALVAYYPGLAMRRIADPNDGEIKSDARDAYICRGGSQFAAHVALAEARRA